MVYCGGILVLGQENRCAVQLRTSNLSWNIIGVNYNSVGVKALAPKGIVYPSSKCTIYYKLVYNPPFILFAFDAVKDLERTKEYHALVNSDKVNRQLNFNNFDNNDDADNNNDDNNDNNDNNDNDNDNDDNDDDKKCRH